jgi:hypothetical protein
VSPAGDDSDVTPLRDLDDRTVELLLSGRDVDGESELVGLIAQMHSLADVPAPIPSSALAAMLEDGLGATTILPVGTAPAAVSWRRRLWALPLQLSLAVAACLALIVGAAAANELPGPAQTAVANAVEAVTPLHVPRPEARREPVVVPTHTPAPAADRTGPLPSSRASHSGDTNGRGGNDDQKQAQPSQGPNGGQADNGGARPRVSPSPDDRQPADKSGDGKGSGDRRKSGSGDGSGSPHSSEPSKPSSHD